MALLSLFLLLGCAAELLPASLASNIVEVYFVVDQQVVQNYMAVSTESTTAAKRTKALTDIALDADYFITEVNEIFASAAADGLDVKIKRRKLDILGTNVFSSSNSDVDNALAAFDNWLDTEGAYSTLKYDVALLWTGHDLNDNGNYGTTGYAHVGTVCKGAMASSVVEHDGTFHTATVTAHEIAHNLGASHDSSVTGYVMAPTSYADTANRWEFSLCSVSDMKTTIGLLDKNCLVTTNSASVAQITPVPDDLKDPEVICKRGMDTTNTYMCKSSNLYGGAPPQGDEVCKRLYCRNPEQAGYCTTVFSSDGLACGTNKICNDGVCSADSSGDTANIDPNCIWGDVAVIQITINSQPFSGSCPELLQKYSSSNLCSYAFIAESCCGSCASNNGRRRHLGRRNGPPFTVSTGQGQGSLNIQFHEDKITPENRGNNTRTET